MTNSAANPHEYVVTWSQTYRYLAFDDSLRKLSVYARRFGGDGLPKTSKGVLISSAGGDHAILPAVAMDNADNSVIAWLRTTNPVPPTAPPNVVGAIEIQRLAPDLGRKDNSAPIAVVAPFTPAGRPSVAMRPSTGTIALTTKSSDGDIYAGRYDFSSGNLQGSWSRVHSRTPGLQRLPAAAMTGNGDYLVVWLDEVGAGSETFYPVSGQIFDSASGAPMEVDSTVSTQTSVNAACQIRPPPDGGICCSPGSPEVPDGGCPLCGIRCPGSFAPNYFEPHVLQVAASESDYAAVWPGASSSRPELNGIQFQRVRGGTQCPKPNDCSETIPLRITGASTDKIDLVLTPGVVLRQGQVDPFFTNPYTGPAEFGRKAVDLIVNGYFANNVFSSYLGEFNFYYNMTEGTRTMRFDPGNCQLYNDFAYNANTAFTDVGGIIFREYNRGSCVETDPGLAYVREYAEGADVRTGPPRTFWIREDYAYSSLLHESGHATFGLREEYCPGAKEDLNYHSNVFDSLDRCIGLSADPNRAQNCRQVHADCSPMRWRADPADDPMTLTTSGKQYGPDCQRRAQCIIDATPQADCR